MIGRVIAVNLKWAHSARIFTARTFSGRAPNSGKSGENAAPGAWRMLQMPRQTLQPIGKGCQSGVFAMLTYERIATILGNR